MCKHVRSSRLAALTILATMALPGCGGKGGTKPLQPDASAQIEAFELDGLWLHLGPTGVGYSLTIGNGSMVYDGDEEWSSNWTIKEYDNELHRFQVAFESGTGAYLPVGQDMSGTYVLDGVILTVQLANGIGSYSPVTRPGSCTDGDIVIDDCNLYLSKN